MTTTHDIEDRDNDASYERDIDMKFKSFQSSNADEFLAYIAGNLSESDQNWILDSGCSQHTTGNKTSLFNFKSFSQKDFISFPLQTE
jgi:hypothetical protein